MLRPRESAAAMLVVLALLLVPCSMTAHAAPKTLRVVAADNYPPYLFIGPDGKTEGYRADLWKLWSQKTGIDVQLEPMQWARAQSRMRNGQADVIDMIFRTPTRDQLYAFSAAYATQNVGIYVDHSIQGIHDADSLRGFKIGVQLGDACIDQLASKGIAPRDMVTYPDYTSMFAAAKTGDVKIFCMDDDPASYYLYLYRDQLAFAHAFTLYQGHFHWAVDHGDQATYDLVARGMARITPEERAALKRKWLTKPVHYYAYARNILLVVLAALGVLILALAWIWILRRAVRRRTMEIQEKNALLLDQSQKLENDQSRMRTLFEQSPDAMWMKDNHGVYIECNARACELLGRPREAIIGTSDDSLQVPTDLMKRVSRFDARIRRTGKMQSEEFPFTDAQGKARTMELAKVPIHGPDGQINGLLGVARDITARRRAERELRIAAVAFDSQDGIAICRADGSIERVNEAFTALTGFSAQEAAHFTLMQLVGSSLNNEDVNLQVDLSIQDGMTWSGKVWISPRQGVLRFVRLTASGVRDDAGALLYIVYTLHDLTAETEARARIEHLEKYDHLTELPNRSLLEEHIREVNNQVSASSIDDLCLGTLLLIGLDNFATPNTTHGHRIGDRILQQSAQRMLRLKPADSTLARFSGDVFALLIPCCAQTRSEKAEDAMRLARTLCETLAKPYAFPRIGEVVCTASIGVSLICAPVHSADILLGQAELAMYQVKHNGKNAAQLFEPRMQRDLEARQSLARELRTAVTSNQFVLHFQPQVDTEGRIVGAEALLRWNHPEHGLLAPSTFIDEAESSGLIEPIGRLVLQQACLHLAAWHAVPELRDLILAVNVSPRQFRQADFVESVAGIVTSFGVDVRQLKLEITEHSAMEDIDDAAAKLHALQDLGVKVSLDDFGTGSSSLAYLTRLPLDQLKIDKSFVQRLPDARNDAHLARSILGMARGMGLEVVAEGVETQAQFAFLRDHGCQLFQGYLFGKPLPLAAFETLLHQPLKLSETPH